MLHYTKHAIEQSASDRYGRIELPTRLPVGARVVENVRQPDGRFKRTVRFAYRGNLDLVLVLIGDTVLTCWLNTRQDGSRLRILPGQVRLSWRNG